jgi:DNA excision repair protein ERCC-2
LGCNSDSGTLVLPSPFAIENFCVLIAHKISTLYKYRSFTQREIVQSLMTVINRKVGNYLVFFPSYEYMTSIYTLFTEQYKGIATIMQSSGMSEKARDEFINQFQDSNNEHLVGFAVLGGVFAESIDLLGERLTGAIVVGVGLPGICLERELIKEYYDRKINAGFAFSYQYPGMIKVLQAAGRVIRSEFDRGMLLLIDTRYVRNEYMQLLPEDWSVRYVKDHIEIAEILGRFWHHGSQ